MKAFNDFKAKAEIKTIGYLTFSGAFDGGRENGWRAAMRKVLSWHKEAGMIGEIDVAYVIKDKIEEELKEIG